MFRKHLLVIFFTFIVPGALAEEPLVFYATSEFQVTQFDLEMYLRNGPPPAGASKYGTRERVLQAVSDLYASRILGADADAYGEALLTPAEEQWIADFEVRLEKIRRYLAARVAEQVAQTDWETEAREQYMAQKPDYVLDETVSVRALLLRTEERTEEEALQLAETLIIPDMGIEEFEAVAKQYTEDDVAKETGGLMLNVRKGQTVKPFEEAAFSLRTPGELSQPVVSRFGVHVIQLLSYEPSRQQSFEEVKDLIISDLKEKRPIEYRAAIQNEARQRMPDGFVEYTNALDELMSLTSNGPLGPN